jgi:prepilin-type N-terminal cleavage/methylation domain-containing protein
MRKRAFTLVEIMIVILIIGLLLAIAVPQFITARENAQEKSCWQNQQKLEAAKHMWLMDYGFPSSSTPTMADLVPEYIKVVPECPTHDAYALGNGLAPVTCPRHAAP